MPHRALADKKVVIIGGASGIGFAVAQAALDEGATVVIASSTPANVQAAVATLGQGAHGEPVNVRDEAQVEALFARIGAFDHLVFTAGDWDRPGSGPLKTIDLAAASGFLAVRFWGAVAAVKHGHEKILPGGSITLTDGMLAHRPMKGAVLSTAFAGAVEHLTRGLAVELAPIRVNAVCPGLVLTERVRGMFSEAIQQRFTGGQPLPRGAEAEEVAQAYIYLMRGGYTTGQVMRVDGGRSVS
jgi:NAD(P)-dependent dehydrogenase (short-subunit alcohol dehydrogenase family)